MIKLGKDPTGYCDTKMIAECKMDFMAKEILSSIFTDKKVKAIIQNACDIIETCYQEQLHIPQELRIRSRGTERHSASD